MADCCVTCCLLGRPPAQRACQVGHLGGHPVQEGVGACPGVPSGGAIRLAAGGMPAAAGATEGPSRCLTCMLLDAALACPARRCSCACLRADSTPSRPPPRHPTPGATWHGSTRAPGTTACPAGMGAGWPVKMGGGGVGGAMVGKSQRAAAAQRHACCPQHPSLQTSGFSPVTGSCCGSKKTARPKSIALSGAAGSFDSNRNCAGEHCGDGG